MILTDHNIFKLKDEEAMTRTSYFQKLALLWREIICKKDVLKYDASVERETSLGKLKMILIKLERKEFGMQAK